MEYFLSAKISSARKAVFTSRETTVSFGVLENQGDLPNPAELLLGAFAACCLKNVQRFSELLGFSYTSASIEVRGERQEKPTKMVAIHYVIRISSKDPRLKPELLHKNIRKFGTIYNTLREVCVVSGEIVLEP